MNGVIIIIITCGLLHVIIIVTHFCVLFHSLTRNSLGPDCGEVISKILYNLSNLIQF